MSDECKLCKEPLPVKALYRLNQIAIREGYCSWICCSMDLGEKESNALLDRESARECTHGKEKR